MWKSVEHIRKSNCILSTSYATYKRSIISILYQKVLTINNEQHRSILIHQHKWSNNKLNHTLLPPHPLSGSHPFCLNLDPECQRLRWWLCEIMRSLKHHACLSLLQHDLQIFCFIVLEAKRSHVEHTATLRRVVVTELHLSRVTTKMLVILVEQ